MRDWLVENRKKKNQRDVRKKKKKTTQRRAMHHQDHVIFSNLHSSSVISITIKEYTKVSFDSPIFILNKKISNLEMYTGKDVNEMLCLI